MDTVRPSACDLEFKPPTVTEGAAELAPKRETPEQEAARLGVTVAKLTAMKSYAALLVKLDKRIKPSTVRKKVAEKFKIKLA